MDRKLLALTHATLREASRQRMSIGAVRLVKLLYLAEVDFYERFRRRLTGATWRYYLYGPFPDDFRGLENFGLVREDIPLASNKVFYRVTMEEGGHDIANELTEEEARTIPYLVKIWGDASLNSLLNHVYFHTPPMRAADKRGEVLDFSTIRPVQEAPAGTKAAALEPSKAKTEKATALLRRLVEHERSRVKSRVLSPRKDQVYLDTLEALSRREDSRLAGEIEVEEDEFPFLAPEK